MKTYRVTIVAFVKARSEEHAMETISFSSMLYAEIPNMLKAVVEDARKLTPAELAEVLSETARMLDRYEPVGGVR